MLAPGQTDTLQFAPEALKKMGYRLATVEAAPPPPPCLQGRVDLDAEASVHVKPALCRQGRRDGQVRAGPPWRTVATLRDGDHVHKDQVMAVIWSTEVVPRRASRSTRFPSCTPIKKFSSATSVPNRWHRPGAIIDAKRDYEGATVDVQAADRTLLSWGLLEKDLKVVYREAKKLDAQNRKTPTEAQVFSMANSRGLCAASASLSASSGFVDSSFLASRIRPRGLFPAIPKTVTCGFGGLHVDHCLLVVGVHDRLGDGACSARS